MLNQSVINWPLYYYLVLSHLHGMILLTYSHIYSCTVAKLCMKVMSGTVSVYTRLIPPGLPPPPPPPPG